MKSYAVATSKRDALDIFRDYGAVNRKAHARIILNNDKIDQPKKKWKIYEVTINVKQVD